MAEELTEKLLDQLLSAPCVEDYLASNELPQRSLSEYLQALLEEKGLARAKVIHEADLNETYGYQIFMGQRQPGRDKLLALTFAMGLDARQTNRVLKLAGHNELYVKNRRDAIIMFCLDKGMSVRAVNEELYRFGEETVG